MPRDTHLRFIALAFGLSLSVAACGVPPEMAEHVRRGDALLEAGRYEQALAAYTRARELCPTDPAVQRASMRARVHIVAAEPGRITPDMADEALYEAEALLEADPSRKAVYLTALANLAMRAGHADEAKAKLEEAVKADPTSALAHATLGALLLTRKEGLAQATAELTAALAAKPDQVGALVGLSRVKAAEGDLPGAAEKLLAALRVRDDFGARMALGGIYAQQQRPGEAGEQFQRAAQLDPKSADALGSLGQALLAAGRPEEAERALRSALEVRAAPATAMALGFALVRQSKMDQALDVFVKILARDAGAAPARLGAAMAAEALGRSDEALGHYRTLLAMKAEGADERALVAMQQDAERHVAALQAAAAASASAAPAAKALAVQRP